MAKLISNTDNSEQELMPFLNDALAGLPRHERDTVLLRFIQGQSLRDTGSSLGISEDTVAKRVSRALDRMREFFRRKGIAVPSTLIASTMAAKAVEAAPAALLESTCAMVAAEAAGAAVSVPIAAAADQVIRAIFLAKAQAAFLASLLVAVVGLTLWMQWGGNQKAAVPAPAPAPVSLSAGDIRKSWGSEWSNIPIADGWPRALPGPVTGTPAIADLDGDGEPEIIVPAMARPGQTTLHPNPTLAAVLFAFHRDGTPVKGWPVTLLDEPGRLADRAKRPGYADNWAASPSVADLDGDGKDEIIITAPPTHTFILNGDGSHRFFPQGLAGGEVWCSLPIVDLNGDRKLDLLCNSVAISADGKPFPGWTPPKPMSGFAPCIGDANGDGKPEVYYCEFRPSGFMHGLNRQGQEMPGWPQNVTDQCLFPPVMGDVNGDGKMEIFANDGGGHLMGWQWNGRPLLPGISADGMTGIFKAGIMAFGASPTLADLDGDGRPEIIVFDQATMSIKAWRGDGKGIFAADGTIVQLPGIQRSFAVTVADLDGDGIMDIFLGTFWVQLARDGKTTVINMLPRPQPTYGGCLIADVDRDGKAEIIFGLSDGQVFIYRTGKAYNESWMQWPTPNGNQRHTGAWRPPVKP